MDAIELDKNVRADLSKRIARHLRDELDVDVGGLQAEMLLDILLKEVGPSVYNRGLLDAQAVFMRRMDDAADDIHVLEKPLR